MPSSDLEVRKEKAFRMYLELPSHGRKRNKNALYEHIMQLLRDGEPRQNIPTTTKGTLYQWAEEEHWESKALKIDAVRDMHDLEIFDQVRQDAIGSIYVGIGPAVNTLIAALSASDAPWKDRINAAEALLDRAQVPRTQVVRTSPTNPKKQTKSEDKPESPALDSTDDVLKEYLSTLNINTSA